MAYTGVSKYYKKTLNDSGALWRLENLRTDFLPLVN